MLAKCITMHPAESSTGFERHGRKRGTRAITLFLGPKSETYMKIKIQKLLPISAAAMLFATLATTASADTVVKIGHVAPLTGGIAHLGKDNENGARLAVEEINAKGLTSAARRSRCNWMHRTTQLTRVRLRRLHRSWLTTRSSQWSAT